MKTYVGVDVQIHVFLTSALIRGDWSLFPSLLMFDDVQNIPGISFFRFIVIAC
jgi:hypothetical protein